MPVAGSTTTVQPNSCSYSRAAATRSARSAGVSVPVTLVFHAFWSADAATFNDQLTAFLKNAAIFGGMLLVWDRARHVKA